MATHSGILAWEIPETEEPGGPQSMGSPRVRLTEQPKQREQQGGVHRPHLGTFPWSPGTPCFMGKVRPKIPTRMGPKVRAPSPQVQGQC